MTTNPSALDFSGGSVLFLKNQSGGYPSTRMRRPRQAAWSRALVSETSLSASNLIWPIFVADGKKVRQPIASMPGVERLSIDLAVDAAEEAAALGIPAIALFPYTQTKLRDDAATEAFNPENLVCRAVRAIKKRVPKMVAICDVALDPYTSHGHDGILIGGEIANDESLKRWSASRLCRPRLAATCLRRRI